MFASELCLRSRQSRLIYSDGATHAEWQLGMMLRGVGGRVCWDRCSPPIDYTPPNIAHAS